MTTAKEQPWVISRDVTTDGKTVRQYLNAGPNSWVNSIRFARRYTEHNAKVVAVQVGGTARRLRVKRTVGFQQTWAYSEALRILGANNGEWVLDAARRVVAERDALRAKVSELLERPHRQCTAFRHERDAIAKERDGLRAELKKNENLLANSQSDRDLLEEFHNTVGLAVHHLENQRNGET